MDLQKASQAILYGAALGDALGKPVEFLKMKKIQAIYGKDGIQDLPSIALFTDDTQMTLALNEALIAAGEAEIETLMQAVVEQFVAWKNAPETNQRAPGYTVIDAVSMLEAGTDWREAGVVTTGCGSAMRVSGVGFLYQSDPERLHSVAHHSGVITHNHPTADAGTIAAAYVVKLALDGVHPDEYIPLTLEFVSGVSEEFDEAMARAAHVAGWGDEVAAIEHIGQGWTAGEAVAMAVYCVSRYPDDYVGAVARAANHSGDSDSVACIAGSMSGARVGLDGIPESWIRRLEKLDYVTDVANRLSQKRQSLYGS